MSGQSYGAQTGALRAGDRVGADILPKLSSSQASSAALAQAGLMVVAEAANMHAPAHGQPLRPTTERQRTVVIPPIGYIGATPCSLIASAEEVAHRAATVPSRADTSAGASVTYDPKLAACSTDAGLRPLCRAVQAVHETALSVYADYDPYPDGRLIACNQAFCRLFEFPDMATAIGSTWALICDPAQIESTHEAFSATFTAIRQATPPGQNSWRTISTGQVLVTLNGRRFWCECHNTILFTGPSGPATTLFSIELATVRYA